MKTTPASNAPVKAGATPRQLLAKIALAKKKADTAERTAAAAKAVFKKVRKTHKQAKKSAKEARRELKALKKSLLAAKVAAARTKSAKARKPVRARKPAPTPAALEPVAEASVPPPPLSQPVQTDTTSPSA